MVYGNTAAEAVSKVEALAFSNFQTHRSGGIRLITSRSAESDHVFYELDPEKKEASFGVFEVAVAGEADDAGAEVVLYLAAHFGFDAVLEFLGVGNHEIVGCGFVPF